MDGRSACRDRMSEGKCMSMDGRYTCRDRMSEGKCMGGAPAEIEKKLKAKELLIWQMKNLKKSGTRCPT